MDRDECIINLIGEGKTTRQVSELLGVHIRTVQRVRQRHGIAAPRREYRGVSIDKVERNQKIAAMSREGHTVKTIAEAFGLTPRTVERIRQKQGVAFAPSPPMNQLELRIADQMLQDGCPYTEVAATLGRHVDTIAKRFPGRGWPSNRGHEMKKINQLLQQCGSFYGITK